ncbi:MAG: tetratricopeptide repeat protein [Rhodospirillales bacterium]|nr:tetratricopeptide repeat protein [Rhodospirillales bacterium]MBT4005878.1 tetratricopeptide repeat protein [Rhodospirillales bacterium]MBT5114163.1 tetratricopeptide repeat protein [Rhodospirillales bacterium]MBT5672691.1 tetratricopeptide repeat protein [Rhodospirillales bacterium]MBT6185639.1 tetratricopeptide repeat protein [Rhodospirillales bacterium]
MNRQVLRRFVILCATATFVMFTVWTLTTVFLNEAPGDYYTREGDNRLTEKNYPAAIEAFDKALAEQANHRGAMMGRAIAYMQSGQKLEARAEYTALIAFLTRTLENDDLTGRGVLAAAYANRGILNDRGGRYKQALRDYILALRTDQEILEGPGLLDKIVYGTPNPTTVRDRAVYLKKQLALPPEKRLLRMPELDAKERTYKP